MILLSQNIILLCFPNPPPPPRKKPFIYFLEQTATLKNRHTHNATYQFSKRKQVEKEQFHLHYPKDMSVTRVLQHYACYVGIGNIYNNIYK